VTQSSSAEAAEFVGTSGIIWLWARILANFGYARRRSGWSPAMEDAGPEMVSIFAGALERSTDEERAAFLDEACGGDAALRRRIEALLKSHTQAGGFLGKPTPFSAAGETQADTVATEDLGFLSPSDKPGSLGRLGHYDVLEVIGKGGMGIVLRAFDEKLHRVVAIKVMAAQLATSVIARQRFAREAQAQAAVSHDHVVTIHAVEEDDGPLPYLVMQYVAGLSLQQRLSRDGPLELHEILRIGMQTAAGLAAAHAQGLVHRDVKPANILLENGVERVKVTDFGLARAGADASLTQSGVIAGTPHFMSPEQARGETVDQRSDLFSLGSVLYAMCTGRPPFRAGSSLAVLKRVCDETPTPIRDANSQIPAWLAAIIDKLHAKDAAQRYQSAAEVAELLGRHLAQVQHPSTVGQVSNLPPDRTMSWTPTRRRPWAAAAAALLCLAVGLSLTEATGVTKLSATIIRVLTPDGTLVVETDDPAVKVTVEGDGGLVITGAGLEEIRLRPGSYRVQADRDGTPVPLEKNLVEVARGGRTIVKVKLVPADTKLPLAEGFTPLFNGKDLTDWASAGGGAGMWRIEDGALTCTGPRDHLLTTRGDFGDFHLRAEVRINFQGNSGIYFRAGKPLALIGDYEAQLTNNPGQQYKTGALYGLVHVRESPVQPETWFTLEIIAVGKRIRVLVNGKETADYTESRADRNTKGHIALQHHDPVTRVFFRKIEIKELPAAKSVEPRAFVLIVQGVAGRKFDTLAEAVAAAADSDVIEIRGNGPFVTPGINLGGKALVIRAGAGHRPVLRLDPESTQRYGTLIETDAPLVLEGLELQLVGGAGPKTPRVPEITRAVRSRAGPLFVAHCRFLVQGEGSGISAVATGTCEVRHSELYSTGDLWWRFGWKAQRLGRLVMDNNIVAGGGEALALWNDIPDLAEVSVRLSRNTIASRHAVTWLMSRLPRQDGKTPEFRFYAAANVFDVSRGVLHVGQPGELLARIKSLTASEVEALVPKALAWAEEGNLYRPDLTFLRLSVDGQDIPSPQPLRDLPRWKAFWALPSLEALQGMPRYQRSETLDKLLAAQRLGPADFRLHADSPGKGQGPGGKDVGADVDAVGPGPAYERWRKTPEYQEWLRDTAPRRGMPPPMPIKE